ncbi:Cell wall / vacuolar inhibitor of fructosidase 1 [Cardamine amara subsp. amara]|uniref:Cell wall / vacuolar inhibitor of fructosidase 1 n=1 Tax=Cardamine amara subsp. amara TaxID=228776 RepID=A0ABD1CA53_CARAN
MLKRALDECKLRYETIVNVDVHTAIIAIKGNPKFGEDAIVDVGVEASICQGGFPKGQSLLTGLTQRMDKTCDVTRAIIRMLL